MLRPFTLQDFLDESNRIEGMGPAKPKLVAEAERFLALSEITVGDMVAFVKVAQPNAVIRDKPHLNVRVGNHVAPQGGPAIVDQLREILAWANQPGGGDPYWVHVAYETLHPFIDGNGRSGRILWLWTMGGIGRVPIGFLHCWYYQSLQNSVPRKATCAMSEAADKSERWSEDEVSAWGESFDRAIAAADIARQP